MWEILKLWSFYNFCADGCRKKCLRTESKFTIVVGETKGVLPLFFYFKLYSEPTRTSKKSMKCWECWRWISVSPLRWRRVNRNLLFIAIGSQYGQFFARSTHKSPCTVLCNLFVIEFPKICCAVAASDVSKGIFYFTLACCCVRRQAGFFVWSTKIAFCFMTEEKEKLLLRLRNFYRSVL